MRGRERDDVTRRESACVRACVKVNVRACVRACMAARMHACVGRACAQRCAAVMYVCDHSTSHNLYFKCPNKQIRTTHSC